MLFGSKGTLVEPVGGIIMGKCLEELKSSFHPKNKGARPLGCTHGGFVFPKAASPGRGGA